jgi:hypothetical protein
VSPTALTQVPSAMVGSARVFGASGRGGTQGLGPYPARSGDAGEEREIAPVRERMSEVEDRVESAEWTVSRPRDPTPIARGRGSP